MRLAFQNILFRTVVIAFLSILVGLLGGILLSVVFAVAWPDFVRSVLDPESLFAIKLTAVTVSVSTVLSVIVGVPAAYALSRYRIPAALLVDTIIDLPLVLPPLMAGISLLVFFQTSVGQWIEDHIMEFVYQPAGIILAIFFPTVSLGVRAMKAAFDAVDRRYEQVARTLGCSELQAFFKVTLPLAANGLVAGAVLTWARALGIFGSIIMFAGATRYRTEVIPVAIFLNMTTGRIAAGISLAVVLLVIAGVSLVAFKKLGGRASLA